MDENRKRLITDLAKNVEKAQENLIAAHKKVSAANEFDDFLVTIERLLSTGMTMLLFAQAMVIGAEPDSDDNLADLMEFVRISEGVSHAIAQA